MNILIRLWHAANRRSDLSILWPICRDTAPSIQKARAAFYLHAKMDRAWSDHYTDQELTSYIDELI